MNRPADEHEGMKMKGSLTQADLAGGPAVRRVLQCLSGRLATVATIPTTFNAVVHRSITMAVPDPVASLHMTVYKAIRDTYDVEDRNAKDLGTARVHHMAISLSNLQKYPR